MAAILSDLVIDKEKAQALFNEAVCLEKEKKAIKVTKVEDMPDYSDVLGLYRKAIKQDPTHAAARLNLLLLEAYLAEQFAELFHNLAKVFLRFAEDEEVGRNNNGIPEPAKAIETYETAIDIYNQLIDYLDSQLSDPKSECAPYKKMIAQKKHIIEKEKSCLPNIITRNRHYQEGIFYEKKMSNTEETTRFSDFIALCKEAMNEYKKAENLGHNGARSCIEK